MSRPGARPKRAAEDFARTHHEASSDGQPSKKPRFDVRNPSALAPDALEDDAVLDADVIGGRGQQVRRNAVNIDGYDSDSDNEGFKGRADAKAKSKGHDAVEKEDNDIFANLEQDLNDGDDSEDDTSRKDGKKKAVRFLDENEIEGQVQSSKAGGHVSADFSLGGQTNGKGKAVGGKEEESSSESDVDEAARAALGHDVDEEIGAGGKKTHAPKLDAFNMRSEQEEGRFDDQGNFVRKAADPDAVHDSWLEGLSKKDMKKAKEASDKRDEERRKKDIENDAILTADVLKTLIPLLQSGETILEALARVGKAKTRRPKWQNIKNKNKKPQDGQSRGVAMLKDVAETQRKKDVEAITGAADLLLTRGQPEIYEAEKELLIRQYRRETGEEWVEEQNAQEQTEGATTPLDAEWKRWEYRWGDAGDGGQIYGPYDASMMAQWNGAGYFGEGVEFRRTGDREWSRLANFT